MKLRLCRGGQSQVEDSAHVLRRPLLLDGGDKRKSGGIPEGHVPLYVGDDNVRFVVRAELLGRPALAELLRRSGLAYGYRQRGVLRIPCPVPTFAAVLDALSSGHDAAAVAHVAGALPPLEDE